MEETLGVRETTRCCGQQTIRSRCRSGLASRSKFLVTIYVNKNIPLTRYTTFTV